MLKGATCIVLIFTLSMFLLSLENPRAHPFFATLIGPELQIMNNYSIRVPLAFLEAYITAFAWTSNISIVFLIPNFSLLFKFWSWELRTDAPSLQMSRSDSTLRQANNTMITYRQLQLLMGQFNECFSGQVQELFMLAFLNQVSVNYGTLKLYKELPLHIWIACPYLSISGAFNLCTLHDFMATSYETSQKAISSWKLPNAFSKPDSGDNKESSETRRGAKSVRLLYKSSAPLKAKYGSLKFVKKDQGIEWVDSLIDTTVTLLLWH